MPLTPKRPYAVVLASLLAAVSIAVPASAEVVKIHEVQGAGDTSPRDGETVTVEAIVVGDFQDGDADDTRNLRGFFLQEEDADADGDAKTSEGVFVFDGSSPGVDVDLGDRVRVSGTVDEFFGETQIDSITGIEVIDSGNALPSPAEIELPAAGVTLSQDGDYQPDLEAFEGMRVVFTGALVINEMFQLDRFNEIKLVAGDRPQQFTQVNEPDPTTLDDYLRSVGARQVTYDDGLNVQNADIGGLDGFGPVFATANAPRMGDTIVNLAGVLGYSWAGNRASGATWRIRSAVDGTNVVQSGNPRPAAPDDVGGTLKVAAFNVLNYFTTIDDGSNVTAIGLGPRGADDLTRFSGDAPAGTDPNAEFLRQRQKLVEAIIAIDADILGLVEIENDFLVGSPGNAIEDLVAALNAELGPDAYAWVDPGQADGFVGADAISVGLIYRPDVVTPLGSAVLVFDEPSAADTLVLAEVLNPFVDPRDQVGDLQRNRPAVAATFEDAAGEVLTVAVNHFKSKGDSNLEDLAEAAQAALDGADSRFTQADIDALVADPNYDQGDGQAFWNRVRTDAARELADWLASDPTGAGDDDVLILGDLNAYAKEDPVVALQAEGFTDLVGVYVGDGAYSFVFDGQTGTLDYALANESLLPQVTGAAEWRINADEADAIDYNLDFGRDPEIFDDNEPARSSDHDPVIVGLQLGTKGPGGPGVPACDGLPATIYVADGIIVGGPSDGRRYYGVLQGTRGSDVIVGTDGPDVILGQRGDDVVCGLAGSDRLLGHGGGDRLFGDLGKDILIGGAGDDGLYGGDDRDTLVGGPGSDDLDGGDGRDICVTAGASRIACEIPR